MSSKTVHVANISHQTSEKEVTDFFSFCGKIESISVTPASGEPSSPQSATVTFEKDTAAKTALLLDNTQLGSSHVQVTSAAGIDEIAGSKTTTETTEELEQEDKPRSRIIAEYLAHGYIIGDTAIQRAVEFDDKNGISTKFAQTLQNFDQKLKATDKAKSLDTSYGVTNKATKGWMGLQSYFEKAAGTPTGQKVVAFYTQGSKQVQDIHAEARRLADLKKQHGVTSGTIYEDGKAEAAAAIPDTSKFTSPITPASATEKETAAGTEKPGV